MGCGHSRIAYNSCRNRHCPKCQGAAARDWLCERQVDLLPVDYFHVVFTLPAEIAGSVTARASARPRNLHNTGLMYCNINAASDFCFSPLVDVG